MAIFIPHDVLLQHILPWLPVKSVARFMCVSKELRSFLSSKTFRRMHNRHIDYHQNPNKFLVLSGLDFTLGIINCEAPDNVLTPRSFRPPIWTKGIPKIRFLTSFHGLVCLLYEYFEDYYSYDLILWNPLTSEYKILSKPKSEISALGMFSPLGMFYSSCGDDYKLVNVISHNDVQIYSLKSDSWKTITFQDTSNLKISRLSNGTCLNENLYFLDYNGEYYSVIRFDTKTETLTEIKGTPTLSHSQIGNSRLTLTVRKGCIHVFINVKSSSRKTKLIELWKINEEGNWKKMETYRGDYGLHYTMNPLHLTSNGMLMYSTSPYRNYNGSTSPCLYNINLKRNTVKKNKPLKKNKPRKWIEKSKEVWPIANMYLSDEVRSMQNKYHLKNK